MSEVGRKYDPDFREGAVRIVWVEDPARYRAGTDLRDITPHDLGTPVHPLMRAAGADVKAIQQQLCLSARDRHVNPRQTDQQTVAQRPTTPFDPLECSRRKGRTPKAHECSQPQFPDIHASCQLGAN